MNESNHRALRFINQSLVVLFYGAYAVLIVLYAMTFLWVEHTSDVLFLGNVKSLVFVIAVPASGFFLLSIIRAKINAPRPYEPPLNAKPKLLAKSVGKSFPSRHCFCAFLIATLWLLTYVPVGVVLMTLACCLAAIRVYGGVHFPRDVVVGAVAGILWVIVGYATLMVL